MRYTKYNERGAIHWSSYYNKMHGYCELVDDTLKPFENKKGTVLDIGCGDGVSSCLLARKGFDVIGVDIEPEGIKLAKEICDKKVDWYCQDVEDFLQDCLERKLKFDYLYSLNTIEHLQNDKVMIELMKMIKEFAIICTDDANKTKNKDYFHTKEYTRESFQKLFKGFNLEEILISDKRYFGYKIK